MRGTPLSVEKCYGMDTALAETYKYLKGDRVSRITVWGMGGIGKTILMKRIRNQFLRENKFDNVIWVTVSSKLNIHGVQNEISMQVDGKLLKEEDASNRARMTLALLQKGNYLLILDDAWEVISYEEVGIPTGGLKLVVTTRVADVAREIDCDEVIKLNPLPCNESLQLFLYKVGNDVLSDDGIIKPSLQATLMEIVDECAGLPLAIVTVASTMRGMSDDQNSWANALNQLRSSVAVVA